MKRKHLMYLFMALAITLSSCSDDDDEESCEKDEICSTDVTLCCDSNNENCTYMVGDEEYASFEDAANALQCSTTGKANIIEKLQALAARVQSRNMQ